MHVKQDKAFLNKLSIKEKLNRICPDMLRNRGMDVKLYLRWYVFENEFPHVGLGKQLVCVLRRRGRFIKANTESEPNPQAWDDLYTIMKDFNCEGYSKNRKSDMSVPLYHVHFYL